MDLRFLLLDAAERDVKDSLAETINSVLNQISSAVKLLSNVELLAECLMVRFGSHLASKAAVESGIVEFYLIIKPIQTAGALLGGLGVADCAFACGLSGSHLGCLMRLAMRR